MNQSEMAVMLTDLSRERTELARENNRMARINNLLAYARTILVAIVLFSRACRRPLRSTQSFSAPGA